MLPKVSVILATYNGEAWLSEQINSVACQAGVEVEILAYDDGSTDRTREILSREPSVQICAVTRVGSAAKNFFRAILDAPISGKYVAFCDQDDIWYANKLQRAIDVMERERAYAYSSAVDLLYSDGSHRYGGSFAIAPLDFLFQGGGQGCTFVLRVELLEAVRAQMHRHPWMMDFPFHDWLVFIIARVVGARWAVDSRTALLYRQHGHNEIGSSKSLSGIVKRLNLLRSGAYRAMVEDAFRIARAAGWRNEEDRWLDLILARRSVLDTGRLSFRLLRAGRRDFPGRLALALAVWFGWL